MATIPCDKDQVTITLPKVILEKVDKLADENFCKRATLISRIVIEYFKEDSK